MPENKNQFDYRPVAEVACWPHTSELYGEIHDFVESGAAPPRVEYMLAALPRSGSTYLSVELWRTGLLGSPMEYPNRPFHDFLRRRLNVGESIVAYWDAVKRVRTSPNGVFGFKMFVADYVNFSRWYPDILPRIAPAKVVFVTRSDLLDQAVSYSKAIMSGEWLDGARRFRRATYDPQHIRCCIEMLKYQIEFWNDIFALTETAVHNVVYEDLLMNRDGVVRGVAEFLGVELSPGAVIDLPLMHIQRNAESAEWVDRYRNEDINALDAAYCLPNDYAGADRQSKLINPIYS